MGKHSASAEKSKNKLRKRVKKREEEKAKAREDATIEISLSNTMTLSGDGAVAGPSNLSKPVSREDVNEADDSAGESEVEAQEAALLQKGKGRAKGGIAFQRDLVARAFAGDNVVRVRENFHIVREHFNH